MKVDLYTKIVLTAIVIALFLNVAGDSKLSVVKNVSADVAGMDSYDLRTDYDFKSAVENIVGDMARSDSTFIAAVEDIAEDVIEGCKVTEPTGFEDPFGNFGKTIGDIG